MDTFAVASTARHITLRITTEEPTQFIDLTDHLDAILSDQGLCTGLLNLQTLHTTTALIVNEHEPLLLGDFTALLDRTVPRSHAYTHDDLRIRTVNLTLDERTNGHAHCRAMLLGSSLGLNVANGRLVLGRWQRVFLVELDGPRPRELSVVLLGEMSR